jgi:hypothetical protein
MKQRIDKLLAELCLYVIDSSEIPSDIAKRLDEKRKLTPKQCAFMDGVLKKILRKKKLILNKICKEMVGK